MSKGSLHFGHGACGGAFARRPPRADASFLQLNHRWMHERWYTWPQFTSACEPRGGRGGQRGRCLRVDRSRSRSFVPRHVSRLHFSRDDTSVLFSLLERRTGGARAPTDVTHLESRSPSVRRARTTLFSPVDSMHTQHCDIVADTARGRDGARSPPAGHPRRAPLCDDARASVRLLGRARKTATGGTKRQVI